MWPTRHPATASQALLRVRQGLETAIRTGNALRTAEPPLDGGYAGPN
jgi:hypothetical protein